MHRVGQWGIYFLEYGATVEAMRESQQDMTDMTGDVDG